LGTPTKKDHDDLIAGWLELLTSENLFPLSQIDQRPDELALFWDEAHRAPLARVLPSERAGSLEDARRDGFALLAWGDPARPQVRAVGAFDGSSTPVPALPTWVPLYDRTALLPRARVLLPFPSEHELRRAFQLAHDAIYKALANDPAATFDLVLLTLSAKILDERGPIDGDYEFATVRGESAEERGTRLHRLLGRAQEWLDGHDASTGGMPVVAAPLASRLLEIFEDHSLSLTADSASGTDLLGTAYEAIVGSTFRGELGSYFTPRSIADFMACMLDEDATNILDPACGSAGLLLAHHRRTKGERARAHYYGNDLNPRMVRAGKVNFLLHGLDPEDVHAGNGLELDRILRETVGFDSGSGYWCDAIPSGPFDAVVANPPFAGHEGSDALLERLETAAKANGAPRSLNRTIPFVETIVAALTEGGMAALVLPTSILNAEEESFVRLRELLLERTEIVAIIGLPEKAFVHTDCGVHGVLLFVRRSRKPRRSYDVFVDWARNLGYDRLGRPRRENDFPTILSRYRSDSWPDANSFRVQDLREAGRWDPAWLHVSRSLPQLSSGEDEFVSLTELLEVRNARFSRREIEEDATYRYFEVADTDLISGSIRSVHEASGFDLRKKGRIRNRVRAGDLLLPNHRDSLIAKGAPTGRSAVHVEDVHDGLLTTDRFLVIRPKVEREVLLALLNSAGVRRQIVAQCRGAASLDIREKTLGAVLVPKALLTDDARRSVVGVLGRISELRGSLAEEAEQLSELIEAPFGANGADYRPAGWSQL
jgi:type I restriction-modification system DNA methylase subunit